MARPFNQPDQWCQHIEQWRESGLSLAAYATRHDLSRATLWRWSVRLESMPAPITLVPATRLPPIGPLVLRQDRWQLELPDSISASWLADLLARLS